MDWVQTRDALLDAKPHAPLEMGTVAEPGVYAWWDLGSALPFPDGFPAVNSSKPLYVGLAKKQGHGDRGLKMHLGRRTKMSGLRRSLAAILRDDLGLIPGGVLPLNHGSFKLVADREAALTEWMLEHFLLTWIVHPSPGDVESRVIGDLLPPLNTDHAAHGPYARHLRQLRAELRAAS